MQKYAWEMFQDSLPGRIAGPSHDTGTEVQVLMSFPALNSLAWTCITTYYLKY